MIYRIAADLTVVLHLAFILVVVFTLIQGPSLRPIAQARSFSP